MAKSSKVPSHSSCDDASDDEPNKNYAKLAKLASRQQRALDKVPNSLNKSDDLLVVEMEKSQKLTGESKILQSRFDDLFSRHEALLTDHEKLAHEFLIRKQELEKVRMSHDGLRTINAQLYLRNKKADSPNGFSLSGTKYDDFDFELSFISVRFL